MTRLKLWGLQRTCTNYLGWLVEANFQDVDVRHGTGARWKHGPPKLLKDIDGHLCVVKHPLAWAASMLRYSPLPPAKMVALWNERNSQLLAFATAYPDRAALIRYIDLLDHLEVTLGGIGIRFRLRPNPGPMRDQPNSMLKGGSTLKGDAAVSGWAFDRTYYTERRWRDDLAEPMLDAFRRSADRGLLSALRYDMGDV